MNRMTATGRNTHYIPCSFRNWSKNWKEQYYNIKTRVINTNFISADAPRFVSRSPIALGRQISRKILAMVGFRHRQEQKCANIVDYDISKVGRTATMAGRYIGLLGGIRQAMRNLWASILFVNAGYFFSTLIWTLGKTKTDINTKIKWI